MGTPFKDTGKPGTRWGRIRDLSRSERPARWQAAWEHLQRTYQPAMVAYTRRLLDRAGPAVAPDEAADVVQGFLAACVEKDWLSRADPRYGRFRVFVRVLLARYTRDHIASRRAQKRRPVGGMPQTLDGLEETVRDARTADVEAGLQLSWARCMLQAAIARVRDRSPRNAAALEASLATEDTEASAIAARIDVPLSEIPKVLYRARRMLAMEIWQELKSTVSDPGQRDDERAALKPFLEGYMDPQNAPSFFGAAGAQRDPAEGSG